MSGDFGTISQYDLDKNFPTFVYNQNKELKQSLR